MFTRIPVIHDLDISHLCIEMSAEKEASGDHCKIQKEGTLEMMHHGKLTAIELRITLGISVV
jgi:hypothetical protein